MGGDNVPATGRARFAYYVATTAPGDYFASRPLPTWRLPTGMDPDTLWAAVVGAGVSKADVVARARAFADMYESGRVPLAVDCPITDTPRPASAGEALRLVGYARPAEAGGDALEVRGLTLPPGSGEGCDHVVQLTAGEGVSRQQILDFLEEMREYFDRRQLKTPREFFGGEEAEGDSEPWRGA